MVAERNFRRRASVRSLCACGGALSLMLPTAGAQESRSAQPPDVRVAWPNEPAVASNAITRRAWVGRMPYIHVEYETGGADGDAASGCFWISAVEAPSWLHDEYAASTSPCDPRKRMARTHVPPRGPGYEWAPIVTINRVEVERFLDWLNNRSDADRPTTTHRLPTIAEQIAFAKACYSDFRARSDEEFRSELAPPVFDYSDQYRDFAPDQEIRPHFVFSGVQEWLAGPPDQGLLEANTFALSEGEDACDLNLVFSYHYGKGGFPFWATHYDMRRMNLGFRVAAGCAFEH